MDRLRRATTWVFDLDHTLYPPEARLFAQIEGRMSRWIAERLAVSADEADALRARWWQAHGTTLAGLMAEHAVDADDFLGHVHDISLDTLAPDPDLRAALLALPARRIVFTNGARGYAGKVLAALGLEGIFDAVYGIEDAGLVPKPARAAFEAIRDRDGFDPARAVMVEDTPENLRVPREMGMATVLVGAAPPTADVDHHTRDLPGFLSQAA